MEYEKPESLSVGRTKKVGKEILINHRITVGSKTTDFDLTAIFDSSTSFTYLNDPVYKVITENFDSEAKRPRINLMAKFLLSTAMTAMGSRKKKRLTE
uniref:Aspartic proteinase nepenthesin-2 n=1 Tax=Solanum tuberosum TaxID=4113 RepID=M1AUW1_SOLTU